MESKTLPQTLAQRVFSLVLTAPIHSPPDFSFQLMVVPQKGSPTWNTQESCCHRPRQGFSWPVCLVRGGEDGAEGKGRGQQPKKGFPVLGPEFCPSFCSAFSALRFHGIPHGHLVFFFTAPFLGQRSPL